MPHQAEQLPTEGKSMVQDLASKPALKALPKDPCSLVVSSIRPTANEQSLRLLFESAGQVLGCKLVKDEATGAHRGFGFVMMASRAEAEAAARKFHDFEVSLTSPFGFVAESCCDFDSSNFACKRYPTCCLIALLLV